MSDSFEDIMSGVLDDTTDIIVDQDMQKAIDRAQQINVILRNTECSIDQMHAYVAEVDGLWQDWHNRVLTMSGRVFFDLDKENIHSVELNSERVYSNSFCIARLPGDDSPQIFHDIKIHPFDVLPEGDPRREIFATLDDDNVPFINAIAPLEVSLDSGYITTERALQYMELFHPDLVVEIDRRIMHTNSPEEALLALRGLPFSAYIEHDDDIARAALTAYLNASIIIDSEMPHQVVFGEGNIYAEAEEDDGKQLMVRVSGETLYVMMDGEIHFVNIGSNQAQEYVLAVDVSTVSADHREVERKFCIPLNVISGDMSMRSKLFDR